MRAPIDQSRRNLWYCLVILGLVAGVAPWRRPPAKVTISGLDLHASRAEVVARLGPPSFQLGHPQPTQLEYWRQASERLNLEFDSQGNLLRLQGGRPEVNAEPVSAWSPAEIRRALGPPEGGASGALWDSFEGHREGEEIWSYPVHRLLVRWDQEGRPSFLLFQSPTP